MLVFKIQVSWYVKESDESLPFFSIALFYYFWKWEIKGRILKINSSPFHYCQSQFVFPLSLILLGNLISWLVQNLLFKHSSFNLNPKKRINTFSLLCLLESFLESYSKLLNCSGNLYTFFQGIEFRYTFTVEQGPRKSPSFFTYSVYM